MSDNLGVRNILTKLDPIVNLFVDKKERIIEKAYLYVMKYDIVRNISNGKENITDIVGIYYHNILNLLLEKVASHQQKLNKVNTEINHNIFNIHDNDKKHHLKLELQFFFLKLFKHIILRIIAEEIHEKEQELIFNNFINEFFDNSEFKCIIELLTNSQNQNLMTVLEQYEINLKITEQKYMNLFNSLEDAFYIIDQDYNFLEYNDIACNRLGYTRKEMSELSMIKINSSNNLEFMNQQYNKVKKRGKYVFETKHKSKSGQNFPVNIHANYINFGEIPAYLIISKNIEIRKIAEKKIKLAKKNYRDLYEHAPNAYLTVDRNYFIKNCNKKAEQLLGYFKHEIINSNIFNFISYNEEDLNRVKKKIDKIKENREIHNKEMKIKKINGDTTWTTISIKPILDKNRNFKESRWAIMNIDKRKKIEHELKESENKYRNAYEKANFFKDILIHDISNILQIIQSSNDLYINSQDKVDKLISVEELFDISQNAVIKGINLVKSARTLSLMENSNFNIKPTDLLKILKDSVELFKKNFQKQKINIEIKNFREPVFVKANELLGEVFDNILNNSSKYNANPIIEILINMTKLELDGISYIKIEFLDNGVGIPDYKKQIIFKEGIMDKARKGMGFGLSLINKIIKSYKGKIWVEDKIQNNHSKGSNFIILIPKANDDNP